MGFPAWVLQNRSIRIVTVPVLGGKIVSLFDLESGQEWLLQPERPPLVPPKYGQSFRDYGFFGWDEMFPTIRPCSYPAPGDYYGRLLPDHGEVWALPWQVVSTCQNRLELSVHGRALPYRLTRRLALCGSGKRLRLDYRLTNTGQTPWAGLWAAHPQLPIFPGDTVHVSPMIETVVNAQTSQRLGSVGQVHTWPSSYDLDQRQIHLDRICGDSLHSSRKVYLRPDQSTGEMCLKRSRERNSIYTIADMLTFAWNPLSLPYLGLWVDEGQFSPQPVVALEPSSGYYDELCLAYQNKRCLFLQPGETTAWELTVAITTSCIKKT